MRSNATSVHTDETVINLDSLKNAWAMIETPLPVNSSLKKAKLMKLVYTNEGNAELFQLDCDSAILRFCESDYSPVVSGTETVLNTNCFLPWR